MIDANSFNFEAMKEQLGKDPFAQEANKYATDERFYTLQKDKDGNGAALIRFMYDGERGMVQRLYSINTTIWNNGKKRFVSEYSPSSIGKDCPFQEKWQELYNEAKDLTGAAAETKLEEAKVYSRGVKFITNIKVLKDPANPENEGKTFLYSMSGKMKDKIYSAISPSEQDRSLGALPKEMYNPLAGNSFRLVAKKGANGQINYDNSEIVNDVTSIFDTVDAALTDMKENSHLLSSLLAPESFMTYDELVKKMDWVNFSETGTAKTAKTATVTVPTVAAVAAVAAVPTVAAVVDPLTSQATVQEKQESTPEVLDTPQLTKTPTETPTETAVVQKNGSLELEALLDGLI
jgi:hypothetical protein